MNQFIANSSKFLLLLLLPLLFSGCLASKMADALAMHKTLISETAMSRAPASKKLDVVAGTYVQVLEEALRFGTAKKAINHVETFSKQNKADLDNIFKEIGAWSEGMTSSQKLLFAAGIATKSYSRQLITLIPKFRRKVNRRIQTFTFLSRLTKLVSPESLLDQVMPK